MIQTQTSAANIFTDLNGLQGIRQMGKENQSAAMMEVAKQFESMFLGMMLKSMREAGEVFSDDALLSSPESDFYRTMYDDQMTLSLASGRGTGFAEVIHRQMMSQYGDAPDAAGDIDQSQIFSRRFHGSVTAQERDIQQEVERLVKEPETLIEAGLTGAKQTDLSTELAAGEKGQVFSSPAEFVAALYPLAKKVASKLGVDPKAIVAQAALETGWGKHMIQDETGQPSHNLFGIKANRGWQGATATVTTHEYREGVRVNEKAEFRSYASLEEGLADYATFLKNSPRYQNAINDQAQGDEYGFELQRSGYATDPNYGGKIQRIYHSDTLNNALLTPQFMENADG